jgi:GMP synthase (glutamine-hydrolysing)
MMAAALGARVAPGPAKEIGWAPLTLTPAGQKSVLAPLDGTPVLHWHGDNCELPPGCEALAFTPHCPVQAFAPAPQQLALQFHLETDLAQVERWLIGHTVELGKAGIDPRAVRAQARAHGEATAAIGCRVLSAWLAAVAGAA